MLRAVLDMPPKARDLQETAEVQVELSLPAAANRLRGVQGKWAGGMRRGPQQTGMVGRERSSQCSWGEKMLTGKG